MREPAVRRTIPCRWPVQYRIKSQPTAFEQIFNRMREESPQLLAKVHPIRADYSAIDLDIDSADRAMLSSEVQVSNFC